MIQLYCGDGKGKTTAAVGLSVRAAGNGLKVLFIQFLKNQPSGEIGVLQSIPGITVERAPASDKFTYQMTGEERDELRIGNDAMLRSVLERADKADLIVLDECVAAVEWDLLDEELLQQFVEAEGKQREIVMTGRTPAPWMFRTADYVTDMEKIRHPFDEGIDARQGIEF